MKPWKTTTAMNKIRGAHPDVAFPLRRAKPLDTGF
jgi:hypothetical protein